MIGQSKKNLGVLYQRQVLPVCTLQCSDWTCPFGKWEGSLGICPEDPLVECEGVPDTPVPTCDTEWTINSSRCYWKLFDDRHWWSWPGQNEVPTEFAFIENPWYEMLETPSSPDWIHLLRGHLFEWMISAGYIFLECLGL